MTAFSLLAAAVFASHGAPLSPAGESVAYARPPKRMHSITVHVAPPAKGVALPPVSGPRDRPLVVIDAGHGGHDPGAASRTRDAREKDVTLALALALRDRLLRGGRVRVALTRSDDRFLLLQERYDIARRLGADLFLSLHADAADNEAAQGATIYTLSETASDREAARLAARENRADVINGVDLGQQNSAVNSILIDLSQREAMAQSADFARLLYREARALCAVSRQLPPLRLARGAQGARYSLGAVRGGLYHQRAGRGAAHLTRWTRPHGGRAGTGGRNLFRAAASAHPDARSYPLVNAVIFAYRREP
jgi:N-acetylmuramoyl-L-alanine amidase